MMQMLCLYFNDIVLKTTNWSKSYNSFVLINLNWIKNVPAKYILQ